MVRLTSLFFFVFFVLTGAVTAALCHQILGADIAVSAMIGGATFLSLAHLHNSLGRDRDRKRTAGEVDQLKAALTIVGNELEDTQRQLAELAKSSETRAEARNRQIISEVRVLETLIEQMAAGVKGKAKELVEDSSIISRVEEVTRHITEVQPERPSVFEQLSQAELLDLVHGALDDNRVDVYLQPIVSLPQRKLRFYESFSHLRTADGQPITPDLYLDVAEAAGLTPLIDNLLLFRCVQIVRRLSQRDDESRIFCNISMHSLRDAAFFPQFLDFLQGNQELARYLIFEFGQDVMSACGPMEKTNLRRLADLGFTYSLDKVTSLDIDLAELRDRQFRYIKVSAELLLSALPEPTAGEFDSSYLGSRPPFEDFYERAQDELNLVDTSPFEDPELDVEIIDVYADGEDPGEFGEEDGQLIPVPNIHAADFRELLDRYGIDLIVEKLESERDVVEVVDLDVDFGQGFVFGEPKPVSVTELDTSPRYDDGSEPTEVYASYNQRAS